MTPYRTDDSREPLAVSGENHAASEMVRLSVDDAFVRGRIVRRIHLDRRAYVRLWHEARAWARNNGRSTPGDALTCETVVGVLPVCALPPGETVSYLETVEG